MMSKGSLQSFIYKISIEGSIADDVKSDISHISKSILYAMNDRVGENAIISINKISDVFTQASESAINQSKNGADALEIGYDKVDGLLSQADMLVSDAERLMGELGDL